MRARPSCCREIIGTSAQIQVIKRCIDRVALSEAAVLLTGESGTGKELFARRVHSMSKKCHGPFIPVNCAAIPDNLIESELFGFEKGAFTGAGSRQDGLLVQANCGTFFLDEIGDLSPSAQAKLLRVLEQKEVRPLGSRGAQTIDFRLVSATNRNLEELANQGRFRQDLLFRINVVHVHIPPLRARKQDIGLIASSFLRELSTQYSDNVVSLTPGAQRRLEGLPWRGNIRELRNILERAFLLCDSEDITERDIARVYELASPDFVRSSTLTPTSFQVAPKQQSRYHVSHTSYRYSKVNSSDRSEPEQFREALDGTHWNKSEAAKLLRCSRMTVYRKIVQYALSPSAGVPDPYSTPELV